MKPLPLDDESLMDLIRVALREEIDPAAMRLAIAAPILVGARRELARLDFDSLFEEDQVALRNASTLNRSLTYVREQLTVDIEILDDGQTVVGQLTPPERDVNVSVQQLSSTQTVYTDEFGRFRCTLATGPVQLRIDSESQPFATPWLTR